MVKINDETKQVPKQEIIKAKKESLTALTNKKKPISVTETYFCDRNLFSVTKTFFI